MKMLAVIAIIVVGLLAFVLLRPNDFGLPSDGFENQSTPPAGAVAWIDTKVTIERTGDVWAAKITQDDKPMSEYSTHKNPKPQDLVINSDSLNPGKWVFSGTIKISSPGSTTLYVLSYTVDLSLNHDYYSYGAVVFTPPTAFFTNTGDFTTSVDVTIYWQGSSESDPTLHDIDRAVVYQSGSVAGF